MSTKANKKGKTRKVDIMCIMLSSQGECEYYAGLPRGNVMMVRVAGFHSITESSKARLMRLTQKWRKTISKNGELAMWNPALDYDEGDY